MALLDRIRRVVVRNRKRLRNVASKGARRIVSLSEDAGEELVGTLRRIAPGRFGSLEVRDVIAPVTSTIQRAGTLFGLDLGGVVQATGAESAVFGRADLKDQLGIYAPTNPFASVASERIAGGVLDPGLLDYYETSRQRYGLQSIVRMRGELAQAALANETLAQAADRLEKSIGLENWKAQQIAGTEASTAFHRRWLRDAEQGLGPESDQWRKQLIAIWDSKTGADSKYVDGQQRPLDKPFEDNFGRVYQMPPNRPNDRETVILVEAAEITKP